MEFSKDLINLVRSANSAAALTGAGISAESGVPTFRDTQSGLWAKYDPLKLATPEAFVENPQLVWAWYNWRRQLIEEAVPNPGHCALTDFEREYSDFTIITQNVDGLHKRAGSNNILELHGNIYRSRCWQDDERFDEFTSFGEPIPTCPNCGSLLRPDVVWFGEQLPAKELQLAVEAARNCDLFFSIGTSAAVHPAASLIPEAKKWGARVVEINIRPSELANLADFLLVGRSGQILPNLYTEAFN